MMLVLVMIMMMMVVAMKTIFDGNNDDVDHFKATVMGKTAEHIVLVLGWYFVLSAWKRREVRLAFECLKPIPPSSRTQK